MTSAVLTSRRSVGGPNGRGSEKTSRLSASRFVLPAVIIAFGFAVRRSYRRFEADSAVEIAQLFGSERIRSTGTPKLLVLPEQGSPFYALVTFGCSSLPVLLTFAVVALLVIRGSLQRRIVAAVIAAGLLFLVNVGRVAAVAIVGSQHGLSTMARVHDWFGTAVTLLGSVLAAVLLYLIAAMPTRRDRAQAKGQRDA